MPSARHPYLLWSAIAAYFIATTLGHLVFSDWLVKPRTALWNGQPLSYAYRDALPYVLPPAALLLLGWLVFSAYRYGTRGRVVFVSGYWLLWAGCVAAVDRWLTFSLPEYFHYPQYALLAWLLTKALDPHHVQWPVWRVLFWATLLGAVDELTQYLWITTRYSHYLDFNDILVNLLAAIAGVMLYYGFRSLPVAATPSASTDMSAVPSVSFALEVKLLASLLLVIALLFGTDRVAISPAQPLPPGGLTGAANGNVKLYLQREARFYDSWQPGAWRQLHWVVPPSWGAAGVLLVSALWAPFGRVGKMKPQDLERA